MLNSNLWGLTPLLHFIVNGKEDEVDFLLNKGVNPLQSVKKNEMNYEKY